MALSASFAYALSLVPGHSVTLASVENEPGYAYYDWSYSCVGTVYTIRGGSFAACEQGAAHLMEAMGFMFGSPHERFWKLPSTIPTNLSATKQQFFMPACGFTQNYGNAWVNPRADLRALLTNKDTRWYELIAWRHNSYPLGHRWQSVIMAFPAYFAANPDTLIGGTGHYFDLANMPPAKRTVVVNLCASYLLKNGLSTTSSLYLYKRAEFGPTDGDENPSDLVYPFTKDVCIQVRAGTDAIEGNPAYAGVPDAQLGLLAYSGARLPPTESVAPYVYTGVAIAFNDTQYTYAELVALHAVKTALLLLREYSDTFQWSHGAPAANVRFKSDYLETYEPYITAGARGMNNDISGSFLVAMPALRLLVMVARTGSYTMAQAIADIVDNIFDGDPKVTELYTLWSNPEESHHRFSLYNSMLIVDQMADGWYKTLFEQTLTVDYEYLYLPTRPNTPVANDAYATALNQLLSHTTGMAEEMAVHSYAWLRILAGNGNTNLSSAYGYLHFGAYDATGVAPSYYSGTAPTNSDYLAAKAALALVTNRAAGLDATDDLVVMHGLTPETTATAPATAFVTQGNTILGLVGPGRLTKTGIDKQPDPDDPDVIIDVPVDTYQDFPAGFTTVFERGNFTYTWTGGKVFLKAFPTTRIEQSTYGDLWFFVPTRCAGEVTLENSSRTRVHHPGGYIDVGTATPINDATMNNLGPGQLRIDGFQTTGFGMITNANVWLSADPTQTLVPRVIAEEDFTNLGKLNKI